jgi:flagellar hook-length control protein FliK
MATQVRTDLLKLPARAAPSSRKSVVPSSADAPRFDEALGKARRKSPGEERPQSSETANAAQSPQDVKKSPTAAAARKKKSASAPGEPSQASEPQQNSQDSPVEGVAETDAGSGEALAQVAAAIIVPQQPGDEVPPAVVETGDDATAAIERRLQPHGDAASSALPVALDPEIVAATEETEITEQAEITRPAAAVREDTDAVAPALNAAKPQAVGDALQLEEAVLTRGAHARVPTRSANAKLESPQLVDDTETVDSLIDVSLDAEVEEDSSDAQMGSNDPQRRELPDELAEPADVARAQRTVSAREFHAGLATGRESNDAPPLVAESRAAVVKEIAPQAPAMPAPRPEAEFAASNHAQIVTGIRGELLPGGGTMQIRLDPPELGALQISVRMQDGVMTASFQTSSDDAAKLLSHSLTHLKSMLESTGVSVEKLHVEQAPREHKTGEQSQQQSGPHDDAAARQEQQRKEMLRRMWRRLAIGSDPLDMVA